MSRRINADHEELIGQHFRLPYSIATSVVDAIHPEEQGVVIAISTLSGKAFEVDAWQVRGAIAAKAAKAAR